MFVVKALKYCPEDSNDPAVEIDAIGFSMVRLMQLSDGKATGVRANLQITDASALDDLAQYYTQNTWLEWTFDIGGGGGSFSVVLRWTKFNRLSGTIQVVRNAVLRDLIREAEGSDKTQTEERKDPQISQPEASSSSPQQPRANRDATAPSQASSAAAPPSDNRSFAQDVSALWPGLFGRNGDFKTDGSGDR